MESEYDRKFEDMKKYIPFLENMIRRLESSGSGPNNPRHAQLCKIRALRDLLLDKNKRMKMDNLLKCEQVLLNLYAKVEQRETLPGITSVSKKPKGSSFDSPQSPQSRSSFTSAAEAPASSDDTLFEIARADNADVVCMPGSKEPALFQRRPKKEELLPKRSYTRVLISPEVSPNRELQKDKEKRSEPTPTKSPKSRKSRRNSDKSSKTRDLNILLQVPQKSLETLNTDNIGERIMNCDDTDVDICTLRELRSQIIAELKKTGTNEDISDFIKKSYGKKKPPVSKPSKNENLEIEEGEISDSESETIENVYGNLKSKEHKKQEDKEKMKNESESRKIQISLIAADADKDNAKKGTACTPAYSIVEDVIDLDKSDDNCLIIESNPKEIDIDPKNTQTCDKKSSDSIETIDFDNNKELEQSDFKSSENLTDVSTTPQTLTDDVGNSKNQEFISLEKQTTISEIEKGDSLVTTSTDILDPSITTQTGSPRKANFYKPVDETHEKPDHIVEPISSQPTPEKIEISKATVHQLEKSVSLKNLPTTEESSQSQSKSKSDDNTECLTDKKEAHNIEETNNSKIEKIPFLNDVSNKTKKPAVSELDILQALKNEILSESINIPNLETPSLHQPKITKVTNVSEIVKKKISIDKYKRNSSTAGQRSRDVLVDDVNLGPTKPRRGLTEKECERFNLPSCLALENDYSSDDQDTETETDRDLNISTSGPQSPDAHSSEEFSENAPVIIPAEPLKAPVVHTVIDIDMRSLPGIKPKSDLLQDKTKPINSSRPHDPRIRKELDKVASHPGATAMPVPSPFTSNRFPNMTPNARSMTPSHQNFEMNDSSVTNKHVYAPSFLSSNSRERHESSVAKDDGPERHMSNTTRNVIDDQNEDESHRRRSSYRGHYNENQSKRSYGRTDSTKDFSAERGQYSRSQAFLPNYSPMDGPSTPAHPFGRTDCPTTPVHPFGRSDCPTTPVHPFGRSDCPTTPVHPFGRSDCPTTPVHPFGRSDCPTTPVHPFGRSDCPTTPVHPFGRTDCPTTPVHPFGRSDCPTTPVHPFGRSDCPTTPVHPFGRTDCPTTPVHPFGRTDCPTTPVHPFGRSEMPRTPSHPFGRSDNLSNTSQQYRRSDSRYSSNDDYNKSRSSQDFRDKREYYEDYSSNKNTPHYNRNSYYVDNRKSFSGGEHYNPKEGFYRRRDHRRDSDERNYGRNFNKDDYSNETYESRSHDYHVGRSKNYHHGSNKPEYIEKEYHNNREGSRRQRFEKERNEFASSHTYPKDDVSNIEENVNKRTISVDADANRSFSIDTSVNATFQSFDFKAFQNTNFNVRRQRAASVGRTTERGNSVGRTLARESCTGLSYERESTKERNFVRATSVGRTLEKEPSDGRSFDASFNSTKISERPKGRALAEAFVPKFNKHFYTNKPLNKFARAQSVGRDVEDISSKTLAETKAHLKALSHQSIVSSKNETSSSIHAGTKAISKNISPKIEIKRDPRIKGDPRVKEDPRAKNNESFTQRQSTKDKKEVYSPRKNIRDPRMQKRQENLLTFKKIRDSKASGIVYTSDNIAKGKVIGPGYGVKNYKIPKIKRNPIETSSETIEVDNTEKQRAGKILSKNQSVKATTSKLVKSVPQTFGKKDSSKTVSSKELVQNKNKQKDDPDIVRKTNAARACKLKNTIIDDSDSNESFKDSNVKAVTTHDDKYSDDLCMDDLTLNFENESIVSDAAENIASDDLIDNIDSLIANLDKDIDPNKCENDLVTQINKDDVFDSLLQTIDNIEKETSPKIEKETSPKKTEVKTVTTDAIATPPSVNHSPTVSNVSCLKLNESSAESEPSSQIVNSNLNADTQPSNLLLPKKDGIENENINILQENHQKSVAPINSDEQKNNSNAISDEQAENGTAQIISNVQPSTVSENILTNQCTEQETEGINSTPDSTVETEEILPEILTNKKPENVPLPQTDNMNPHVSSTLDSADNTAATSKTNSSEAKDISSISSILSLLNNKSKIQELLAMIGDKEGEKLKKKLEKLSEIVSDDEEEDTANVEQEDNANMVTERPKTPPQSSAEEQKELLESPDDSMYKNDTPPSEPSDESIFKNDSSSPVVSEEVKDSPKNLPSPKQRKAPRKTPLKRKGIGKRTKKKQIIKHQPPAKRMTRSEAAKKPKKTGTRELKKLQDDIRDMFMSNDVLNATGIRMCRIAKLSEDKNVIEQDDVPLKPKGKAITKKTDPGGSTNEPTVILEKMPVNSPTALTEKPPRKKPGPKPKLKDKQQPVETEKSATRKKPGPKSKTKIAEKSLSDPYDFESDSNNDNFGSDAENVSLSSFVSTERSISSRSSKQGNRRSGLKTSVQQKLEEDKNTQEKDSSIKLKDNIKDAVKIPDLNCFTDMSYCFDKDCSVYSCRLCIFEGENIVGHYKNDHPHYEIPLSRMNKRAAKAAIKQSMVTNFQKISKSPVKKYICRFCNIVFDDKRKQLLEVFFWHVVSNHTGEYKQLCSECLDVKPCPFVLDIPPPPKNLEGLLMGYICGKCNYIQLSLENVKNHVSLRHNDEETEVYTISLSVMSQAMLESLEHAPTESKPKRIKHLRKYVPGDGEDKDPSDDDTSETISRPRSVQSKISFESEDNTKSKEDEPSELDKSSDAIPDLPSDETQEESQQSSDILEHPHFKINLSESGTKEYICAATGGDDHYKTTLLISIKKHVQRSHATENWDGYCFFCKVIVMPQGRHSYKDCLQHFLDKHSEDGSIPQTTEINKPVEEVIEKQPEIAVEPPPQLPPPPPAKPLITLRPLSDLLSTTSQPVAPSFELDSLPRIESVVSLNSETHAELPAATPLVTSESKGYELLDYENPPKIMLINKHRIVLDTMLSDEKLAHIYKCPARYCSFTSDFPEDALIHLSTHGRLGCEDALMCCYCSYNCSGNSIDLVSHVFREHKNCQYSCKNCFYRARSAVMVERHFQIAHPIDNLTGKNKIVVMSPKTFDCPDRAVLSRNEVVKMYICVQDQRCVYKTPTPEKFNEHLISEHGHLKSFHCSECTESRPSPGELIGHLSAMHDLKSFQCAWCVYGGATRHEIFTHCCMNHPNQLPRAYWRKTISTQDGARTTVLPLVSLSAQTGEATFVTSKAKVSLKSDPVREAERASELEKLVGHTPQIVESAPSNAIPAMPQSVIQTSQEVPIELPVEETATSFSNEISMPPAGDVTPPVDTNVADRATPILKQELVDTDDKKPTAAEIVISLDSDDDNTESDNYNVIELSDSDHETTEDTTKTKEASDIPKVRLPLNELYLCNRCKMLFKSARALKTHVLCCVATGDQYDCAHCNDKFSTSSQLVTHYDTEHAPDQSYCCGLCAFKSRCAVEIKHHLNQTHGVIKYRANVVKSADGLQVTTTLNSFSITKRGRKRKRDGSGPSTSPEDAAPARPAPAPKRRRYGPADAARLPITPIFEDSVHCALCEFHTKVRSNMVRHLQAHAQQRCDLPAIAPVNPVPHLETNQMHFDRMLNLASSSLAGAGAGPGAGAGGALPYPRYVEERARYVCGALGCTYLALQEEQLRAHWEALHAGATRYHCKHCPPTQHLDTTRPLIAARILAHLKMHDARLYGCSHCLYYHHLRHLLDKHLADKHGGAGHVVVVRELPPGAAAPAPPAPAPAAPAGPTMDLRPWQCGLCSYSDMLRQKVVDHCSALHNSKFQFKCTACPWRTSTRANVTKHHQNSHKDEEAGIFYYYYQSGSVGDVDGRPLWVVQMEGAGAPEPQVKQDPEPAPAVPGAVPGAAAPRVDVNIVKQEPGDGDELAPERLRDKYGHLCDPNGLLYKCPLCEVVTETDKISMQSHLFEELNYRRWICNICSYKAFHKQGLAEHALTEHKGMQENASELPQDKGIEAWVELLLKHQAEKIAESRLSIRNIPGSTQVRPLTPQKDPPQQSNTALDPAAKEYSNEELEKVFGAFGTPSNMMFSCPKCNFICRDEATMSEHLEMELTRVRWCCSLCPEKFPQYHAAQLHCRSAHPPGAGARCVEAPRSPAARAAWPRAVLQVQKLSMNVMPLEAAPPDPAPAPAPPPPPQDLLVVRYEEPAPAPAAAEPAPPPKRPHSDLDTDDSDDDSDYDDGKLVVYQPSKKTPRSDARSECPHCPFTSQYPGNFRAHVLKHYGLKPYSCGYCKYDGQLQSVERHMKSAHPGAHRMILTRQMPDYPPGEAPLKSSRFAKRQPEKIFVCLICEGEVSASATSAHVHPGEAPQYAKSGDLILKCNACSVIKNNVSAMQQHSARAHPQRPPDYSYTRLEDRAQRGLICKFDGCQLKFQLLDELKKHYADSHTDAPISFTITPDLNQDAGPSTTSDINTQQIQQEEAHVSSKVIPQRVVAKKSTTKLP